MASTFISLNGNALTGPRSYFAMARDGLFPAGLCRIHPRFQTPANAVIAQGTWAIILTVAGTMMILWQAPGDDSGLPAFVLAAWRKLNQTPLYDVLYTYVIFGANVFYLLAVASVFVLRVRRPDAPRPYRTWGYPFTPLLFVLGSMYLLYDMLHQSPAESLAGLGIIAARPARVPALRPPRDRAGTGTTPWSTRADATRHITAATSSARPRASGALGRDPARSTNAEADEPKERPNPKTEADARMELVLARYGTKLDEAARKKVRGEVEAIVRRAEALRKFAARQRRRPLPRLPPLPRRRWPEHCLEFDIGNFDVGPNATPDDDLAFAPLSLLGARLRSGEVSAVELARFFLDRLEKHGSKYNCVVTVTRDLAIEQARQADADLKAGRDRGPLHGIPYGAKDLLATRGIPTTWGCAPYKDRVIDHDATVVTRLRQAGAVLAAKLSMVEVAGGMGYHQANASLTGPGLNPWKRSQWSGGSSSGSGSAVAAGLVPFAIGTETWGSITTPSSYCGLTGLRPTYGRVSRAGAMALSWTLDKIGPMARTAHDCGLVLDAIAGPDPDENSTTDRPFQYPPADTPGRPWKLAVIKDGVKNAQPEVRDNFERALDVFKALGTIEEIELPALPFDAVASTVLSAEKASAFEEMVAAGDTFKLTAPEDHTGGFAEQAVLATDYLRAQRLRARLCRALDDWLAPFDAVLTVPTADAAPTADGPFEDSHSHISMGGPGNVCGTPAIVVPTGLTRDGLPTALQLDGRAYSENRLLALAVAFQNATAWHAQHPEVIWERRDWLRFVRETAGARKV